MRAFLWLRSQIGLTLGQLNPVNLSKMALDISSLKPPEHSGHHLPLWTLFGIASHSCPSAQRQRRFDSLLIYEMDRQSPPRRLAQPWQSSIVQLLIFALLAIPHLGHQVPVFLMLPRVASHSWPSLHLQRSLVRLFVYTGDRHFPPFNRATLRHSAMFPLNESLRRRTPHTGHH